MDMTTDSQNMLSKRSRRTLEIALALGGFALGTGEFTTMGLMPQISYSLSVSEPQVGHIISSYALGVVVGAPLLAILGAAMTRRNIILLLMSVFIIGNIASAFVPDYFSLLFIRFLTGLPHGAYFGIAGLVAASIVPVHERARAVSRFLLGVTLSIVAGTPLATWLGQLINWRCVFILVGFLAITALVMIFLHLPDNKSKNRSNPLTEIKSLKNIQIWLTLGIAAIGFAGMFCVFSYLVPTLTEVAGINSCWTPVMLSLFGVGSVIGNVLGGKLCDRFQFNSVGYILAACALALLIFPFAMETNWAVTPGVMMVGAMMAMSPALQVRLMDVAKEAQTLAAALNHAAFNIANALGPWLGGLAISSGFSWTVTGYVGMIMAILGLGIFFIAKRIQNSSPGH
ncbi:MFS transporter [Klebsiella variicola subsp. variicola]|nr:MFS transporter [Klebsiella variicola subsp. variicola]